MNSVAKEPYYPKEVFFLGAGTSVLAGVPTFTNFFDKADKISWESESEVEFQNLFFRVLSYWSEYFLEYNIEQFYAAFELNEILGNEYENLDTKDIEKFIYLTIKKSLTDEYQDIYKMFLNIIGTNEATIITTNWDIVLESVNPYLLGNGWVNYEKVIKYNDSNEYKTASDFLLSPNDSNAVKDLEELLKPNYSILKLHGSLNWGFCSNCGKIYYFTQKVYDELMSLDGLECKSDKCIESKIKLKTVIVPPTLSKLIRPEPETESKSPKLPYYHLVDIWKRAYDCLKSCEKLYFIGYSFPETDIQMKIFISNAIRENKNLKEVIIVSNPKHGNLRVSFEERYLSIFKKIGHDKIKFDYNGFKEFCMHTPYKVIFD